MSKEIDNAVDTFLSANQITYSVAYVGEMQKAWNDGDKATPMDQWIIAFKRGKESMQEMYFTGIGLRTKAKPKSFDGLHGLKATDKRVIDWHKKNDKPCKPSATSVLYSLTMDMQAMHESFNDWCDNYGYDSDSMKAFKTYQDCCEIGKKMVKIFTKADIDTLRDMLQDY